MIKAKKKCRHAIGMYAVYEIRVRKKEKDHETKREKHFKRDD